MENQNKNLNVWYEKTWAVILLCILFFPVGLYALWKNSTISKGWKIGVSIFFALIIVTNIGDKNENVNSNSSTKETPKSTSNENRNSNLLEQMNFETIEVDVEDEKANIEKQNIIKKLKARAKRDWPDDYMTQEYWVNQQIEDYEYMLTIENNSIKKKAQRDWPLDFSTQKYWYNEQIEAKERME